MSIVLDKKQCLIAGDGELPVAMAESAQKNGFDVVAISLSSDNRNRLKKYCSKVYNFGPGEVLKIKQTLIDEKITQVTFIGKVHKGLLEQMGICVLDQTIFIKNLMAPPGVLGVHEPDEDQALDVEYGYWLAKEMGKLDVGQSVVIKNKMIMAVEAIEGTDKCIERGCKLGGKGITVVKVSKPTQDKRFDIPAIGLNTLKTMDRYGAKILAIEANETIIVDQKKVIDFANKKGIIVMAI